jgi:hypothetical protein
MGRIRDMVKGALDRCYAISKRRQNLVRAFRVFDDNSSNNLSRAELDRGLTRMGLWLPLEARQQLFAALDRDRDGLVNIDDFKRFLFTDEKSVKGGAGVTGYASNAELLEDDTTALKRSMKRRRVMGVMGKELQRRFRDYDLGDALLYALHGVMPDDYSGDVSLHKSEFEAILLKAQVPITAEELRWVIRTFTVPDEDDRGFRLERLEAAPLINFALGASDPWVETGSLEEILASITPEEMERLESKQQVTHIHPAPTLVLVPITHSLTHSIYQRNSLHLYCRGVRAPWVPTWHLGATHGATILAADAVVTSLTTMTTRTTATSTVTPTTSTRGGGSGGDDSNGDCKGRVAAAALATAAASDNRGVTTAPLPSEATVMATMKSSTKM